MGKPEYPGENPLVRCSANPMILILMRVSLPPKLKKTTKERETHTYTLTCIYIYDLVPKGVHENRTKGVENKVDDTLKLVVLLECAQC